jgi:hypothetical protein
MKRNLIAAVLLALGTNVALADNNFAFDDAYWKQATVVQSAQATESKGKYDLVDRYNP